MKKKMTILNLKRNGYGIRPDSCKKGNIVIDETLIVLEESFNYRFYDSIRTRTILFHITRIKNHIILMDINRVIINIFHFNKELIEYIKTLYSRWL